MVAAVRDSRAAVSAWCRTLALVAAGLVGLVVLVSSAMGQTFALRLPAGLGRGRGGA
jgi:hypothetical protein